MRINWYNLRSGSASLETVLLLPLILVGLLVAQYITNTSLNRGDTVTYGRSAATHLAFNGQCGADIAAGSSVGGLSENITVACRTIDGEKGLRAELPFWAALKREGSGWPQITQDVAPKHVLDATSLSKGEVAFTAPPFLTNLSGASSQEAYRVPVAALWTHYDGPFKAGYDPVLYVEFQKRGTYRLFPNVFPAARQSANGQPSGLPTAPSVIAGMPGRETSNPPQKAFLTRPSPPQEPDTVNLTRPNSGLSECDRMEETATQIVADRLTQGQGIMAQRDAFLTGLAIQHCRIVEFFEQSQEDALVTSEDRVLNTLENGLTLEVFVTATIEGLKLNTLTIRDWGSRVIDYCSDYPVTGEFLRAQAQKVPELKDYIDQYGHQGARRWEVDTAIWTVDGVLGGVDTSLEECFTGIVQATIEENGNDAAVAALASVLGIVLEFIPDNSFDAAVDLFLSRLARLLPAKTVKEAADHLTKQTPTAVRNFGKKLKERLVYIAGANSDSVTIRPVINPSTSVVSQKRNTHILYGDQNGGGHLWPGSTDKTPFPKDWNEDKIISVTSDIATRPDLLWVDSNGNRLEAGEVTLYTKTGKPRRFVVRTQDGGLPVVDGVPIRVVVEPAGEGIVTSFPDY